MKKLAMALLLLSTVILGTERPTYGAKEQMDCGAILMAADIWLQINGSMRLIM
mgnify:CR=1 FL=1